MEPFGRLLLSPAEALHWDGHHPPLKLKIIRQAISIHAQSCKSFANNRENFFHFESKFQRSNLPGGNLSGLDVGVRVGHHGDQQVHQNHRRS